MKNLKLALLGATFLVGASALSGAYAADVYSRGGGLKDTGPVDYAPAITWTGFYIGAHVGSTLDHSVSLDFDNPALPDLEGEGDNVGIFGFHLGYNWQTAGNIVLGIEGSVTFPFDSDEFATDTLSSIRGRLGYSFGSTLIYSTGGVAFASSDAADDTQAGWVAGAGIEHKIRSNVSLGLEGLYYSFEDDFAGARINGVDIISPVSVEEDFWTIQARLTYHFNSDRHSEALK